MTTRFWVHSVPACRALQTRLGQVRNEFFDEDECSRSDEASDAKRLALRKAVLSQWTEQLEIAGEQKCRKADAGYFIQAWLACQETLFAGPLV